MTRHYRAAWLAQVTMAILIWGNIAQSQQATYYVSPTGNDNNSGAETSPFRTVAKARDTVRTVNRNMTHDIVVYLRAGTYLLDQTVVFEDRDSGMNDHVVVYRSYPGERAMLSGGRSITGWKRSSGSMWTATTDIPDFRQLYVNGKRATRAKGGALPSAEPFGGDGYKTSDLGIANWQNPGDLEFVYDTQWERSIAKVARIEKDSTSAIITMQQPYFTLLKLKDGVHPVPPTFMENALELLDQPGEWYLDKHTHQIYYIPRPGEEMEKAQVIAPALERLLELRGTLDQPVHNIRFEGITFSHASWLRPSEIGHINIQANFIITPQNLVAKAGGAIANIHNENLKSPSAIVLHAAKAVRFERCTFTQFGGGGMDIEFGSQDNVISGSHFYDLSGSAIQIGDVIDHHPQDPREIVKDNKVLNNYIHDVALQYVAGVGVFVGYTDGTVISHNEISNLPYSAISIGWGWGEEDVGGSLYFEPFFYKDPTPSRNIRAEFNHIHNIMLERIDGGGIYTLGRMPGTVIRGNVIHDNVGWFGGIYLDEGSADIEVTGNVVYNVARPMNFNNRVQNRIATCHEHDNYFGVNPTDANFPKDVVAQAGLESQYRDLLTSPTADHVH